MSENTNLTYYQRNREVMLKIIMKMIKRDYGFNQEINTETYLKKNKIKEENMEKIDITVCLKKRNKDYKNIKKIIVSQESHNITINKIIF